MKEKKKSLAKKSRKELDRKKKKIEEKGKTTPIQGSRTAKESCESSHCD